MISHWMRFLAGVVCSGLAAPATLLSEAQPDSVVVHSIYAGKQLGDLLTGVAVLAKGAFTTEQAEKIQQELWSLSGQQSNQRQINKTYSYLVQPREDHSAVLMLYLLSTESYRFDVTLVSDSRVMQLVRAHLKTLEIDSLIPFDRGLLTLKEERAQGEEPHLVLALRTVRQFSCLGYYIDHELRPGRDTIQLSLHGVTSPQDVCPMMIGPARMARELMVENRRYTLLVTYRKTRDRLVLEISDWGTVVTGRDSSLVEADERPRWRYPRNSFAFRCSNVEVASAICGDIEGWLVRQPGISPLSIPPGWINPYSPDPARRLEERITLFRYTDVPSFAGLRLASAPSTIRSVRR